MYVLHICNSKPQGANALDSGEALQPGSVNIGFIIISSIQICYGRVTMYNARSYYCVNQRRIELYILG